MSDFFIWVPLLAVVSVGAWFLFFRTPVERANPEFVKTLDLFTDRVQAATLQLTTDFADIDEAWASLQEFKNDISDETTQDIETLGKLWQETAKQIKEFGDQSVQSTLQSSLLSQRIHKQKESMKMLTDAIKKRYS